jgi:hypothetical protein
MIEEKKEKIVMQTRQNPAREGKKEAKIYNEAKLSTQTFTLSPPP